MPLTPAVSTCQSKRRPTNVQDNIPILRDSISLSLHTRAYPAAVSARHHLLTIRPQMKGSWVGLMVAHYLNASTEDALAVYDGLTSTFAKPGSADPKEVGMSRTDQAQLVLFVV